MQELILYQNTLVLCGKHFLHELTTITALLKGYFKLATGSKIMHFDCYMCKSPIGEIC